MSSIRNPQRLYDKGDPGLKQWDINNVLQNLSSAAMPAGNNLTTRGSFPKSASKLMAGRIRQKGFLVQQKGLTSVTVWRGTWKRNGQENELAPLDASLDYLTLSGLSAVSTTYYITLTLASGGSEDPALKPTSLGATAETVNPIETTSWWQNIKFVVATVETNTAGEIAKITQLHLGDIDDLCNIPDGYSLAYLTGTDAQGRKTEINGWAAVTSGSSAASTDLFMVHPTGSNQAPKFCTLAQVLADATNVGSIITAINGHGSGELTNVSDTQAWKQGSTYDATLFGHSIGKSISTKVIDLDNNKLVTSAAAGDWTVDWANRQLNGQWKLVNTSLEVGNDTLSIREIEVLDHVTQLTVTVKALTT